MLRAVSCGQVLVLVLFRLGSATVGLQPGAIGLPQEKGTVHPGFLSSDMSDS